MNLLYSLLLLFFTLFGQIQAQSIKDYNEDRLKLTQQGMLVLGGWATTNIISSPILANNASGSDKYFHQMNGYWNGFNLVIAGFGYWSARKSTNQHFTLRESIEEQQKIEKTLLFNAGLDLAYVAGGFYLIERSKNTTAESERLEGFGQSLILQGGFLFAFDLIFYLVQKKHGAKLLSLVDNLSLSPTGVRIVWKI